MRICRFRKFFGRPTAASPNPQQAKLAFKKPYTSSAVKGEHEEVDGAIKAEDRKEADSVEKDVADEDVNMDSNSEVHEPAKDTKQASPVVNGTGKTNSALANGKSELSV